MSPKPPNPSVDTSKMKYVVLTIDLLAHFLNTLLSASGICIFF